MTETDSHTPYITNGEIARILFQIGALLEMMQCSVYRVRAYRRAALGVLFLPKPVVEYIANDEELPLPGVGERIRGRLHELANTGQMGAYDALLEELGQPLVALLSVEGIGPKTAVRLVSELQIESLQDLLEAAKSHRIRTLRGFGAKREERIGTAAEEILCSAA